MKPSEALHSHRAAIRLVVEAHHARNARVFGSVLRGLDTEHSDLDSLIEPTQEMTLFDIGAIRYKLRELLERFQLKQSRESALTLCFVAFSDGNEVAIAKPVPTFDRAR